MRFCLAGTTKRDILMAFHPQKRQSNVNVSRSTIPLKKTMLIDLLRTQNFDFVIVSASR